MKPLRDLLLVERIVATMSPGGIHLPQTFVGRGSAKMNAKADYYRARVLAVGPDVRELAPGDEVLVHTWAGENGQGLYSGATAPGGVLIKQDDVIAAVEAA